MYRLVGSIAIAFPFLLLWLLVLTRIDRGRGEPHKRNVILTMIIAGGVAVLPAWASYFVNPLWFTYSFGSFAFNFFVVGLAEELIKFLTFILMARWLGSIREPQDGVLQGAAVGVGFSLVEDVLYGFWYDPVIALLRCTLVGFHAFAGALWGFAWAGAVYENANDHQPRAYRHAILAFIPVALLHSLYNTFSDTMRNAGAVFLAIIVFQIVLLFLCVRAFRWMKAHSPYERFPYAEADTAIAIIQKGIRRNPGSRILRRRLAVYFIAAGRYEYAISAITWLMRRGKPSPALSAFYGVAYMGANDRAQGTRILKAAVRPLSAARRAALEKELLRVAGESWLRRDITAALNGPERGLDEWAVRREYLRRWHEPRVAYGTRRTRHARVVTEITL